MDYPFDPAEFGIRGSKLRAMQSMNKERVTVDIDDITPKKSKKQKAEPVEDSTNEAENEETREKKGTTKRRSNILKRKRDEKKDKKTNEEPKKKEKKISHDTKASKKKKSKLPEGFSYITKSKYIPRFIFNKQMILLGVKNFFPMMN
jgi:hypothetical protein